MTTVRYRWAILVMVYLCVLVFAFTLQFLPPILPLVLKALTLTHTQAGLLMSFFALPTIFLSVFSGYLTDLWGPFRVGILSLILVILGTLAFVLSGTFQFAAAGRIVAGVGAVALSIVAAQTLSHWFRGYELGTAMGIYNTAMPVGTIICFATFGKWGESLGWRFPVLLTVFISMLGLAGFLSLFKPAPNQSRNRSRENKGHTGLISGVFQVGPLVWLAGFCWMWFNAAAIAFSTFAPDFFVSKGYSIGFSGFLASLLMWGSLGLSPVIGRVIDRFNNNDVFIGMGGLLLAASIFAVTKSTNFLYPMLVMAVAVALVPTPVFSFLSKVLPERSIGLGFGILAMLSGLGMFFGPYLAGLIRDKTGSYEMTLIFLSGLSLLISLSAVVLGIKLRKENPPFSSPRRYSTSGQNHEDKGPSRQ